MNHMVIVVASDQHLGYANSNVKEFESFLDGLAGRSDVTDLVILGDFVDMWRRDVSGLFLEYHSIVEKVLALQQKMRVRCVAGNHDYHLLKLQDHGYPLIFEPFATIQGENFTYVLRHGWEFDLAQQKPVMELLCDNMSDEGGKIRSDFWDALRSLGKDIWGSITDLSDFHGGRDKYIAHLLTPPKERLLPYIGDVEKRALASVGSGEILIFGHTHRPFVNSDKNVANSGSWVSDEDITNTYVELEGKEIHLMQYGKGEITDAVTR